LSLLSNAATFARSVSYDDLPEKAIEIAKLALIDYLGVTLAGSTQPVSRLIQEYARMNSTRCEARVIGTDIVVSRNLAALANGVAGHALDYDDCNSSVFGHPTVPMAPALFATGELTHASGKEIIKAYVVGMEVQNKIAQLISRKVSENGWHTTSVFGTLGAAAVTALLTGANHEEFVHTLGIAASMSSGIRANFGTSTKPYHAGMAAPACPLISGFILCDLIVSGIYEIEKTLCLLLIKVLKSREFPTPH
jgi:2-methylcitrate dehydratase PrpD